MFVSVYQKRLRFTKSVSVYQIASSQSTFVHRNVQHSSISKYIRPIANVQQRECNIIRTLEALAETFRILRQSYG